MAAKRKNPKSCPRGKKLVKFKMRSFCAGPKRKGGSRRKTGIAKMSEAARKALMRKTCSKMGAAKKKKMAGLCNWAKK